MFLIDKMENVHKNSNENFSNIWFVYVFKVCLNDFFVMTHINPSKKLANLIIKLINY